MTTMVCIGILAFLIFTLCFKMKIAKRGTFHEDSTSLDVSKGIQGVCAICIILHHLSQKLEGSKITSFFGYTKGALPTFLMKIANTFIEFFNDKGVIFVGIFFFFSGYGLIKSLRNKDNYLHGFLKKRLVSILIPTLFAIIFCIFFNTMISGKLTLQYYLRFLLGISFINGHMWFIGEIIIFYIAFYLFFRFIKKEWISYLCMGLFISGFIAFCLFKGHSLEGNAWFMGEWWYNSSMLFFIGMIIARFSTQIRQILSKPWIYYPVTIIMIVLTVVFYKLTNTAMLEHGYWSEYGGSSNDKLDKFITLMYQLPMIIFAVFSLLLVMLKIRFANPIMKFLGSISLEVYLIHNMFLIFFRNGRLMILSVDWVYIVAVLIVSIIFGYVLHLAVIYIMDRLKNKPVYKKEPGRVNYSINCMRLLACFLVIAIHFPYEGRFGQIVVTFGKIAVPFFMIVAGYFCYRKDPLEFNNRLKKQIKKIFILTVVFNLFYALAMANLGLKLGVHYNRSVEGWLDFILYNENPTIMHLWYLGSLLYALCFIWFLNKIKLYRYLMFGLPALLLPYIILTYVGDNFIAYRNALFIGVPYLTIGALIRRYEDKLVQIKPLMLFGALTILIATSMVELFLHDTTKLAFISTELLVIVLVIILVKYPNIGKNTIIPKIGAKYSLFIYLMHPLVLYYIWYRSNNLTQITEKTRALAVLLITLLLGFIFYKICDLFKRKAIIEEPKEVKSEEYVN